MKMLFQWDINFNLGNPEVIAKMRSHNLKSYDLQRLAYETPDFSGAEIEQTLIEAMHIGFSQNRDFTTDDILEAASQIIPLARTAGEQIQFLQNWAAAGKARLASKQGSLSSRIQRQFQWIIASPGLICANIC